MNNELTKSKSSTVRGFTLVELLVVVAIIAVLAVVGITIFSGTQNTAKDARRKADIDSIASALEAHYNTKAAEFCPGATNPFTYCAPLASWFSSGAIPTDPNGGAYTTYPADNDTTYTVCANLAAGGTYCRSQQR